MNGTEVRKGRPPKGEAEMLGEHIAAVAAELFIELGYSGTSMSMVAARARVGKQTLYRRFPHKSALFRDVMRRRLDATLSDTNMLTGCDPPSQLKLLGRAALDIVLDPEFLNLYRVVIGEALSFPELAASLSDHFGSSLVARCVEAVQGAQAIGMCRPGNPETLAGCFLWGLVGPHLLKSLPGLYSPPSAQERDEFLAQIWVVFFEETPDFSKVVPERAGG